MLAFFDITSIPVIIVTVVIGILLVFHLYVLWKQPESPTPVAFKVRAPLCIHHTSTRTLLYN